MTNVTRKKILSSEFKEAEKLLTENLSSNAEVADLFIKDFLTESERIMFIKRFAALWMFANNYSPYRVWNTLYISPTTAARIYEQYEAGAYDLFLNTIPKKKAAHLLTLIADIISAQVDMKARRRLSQKHLR